MRIGNLDGRLTIFVRVGDGGGDRDGAVDVATASDGRFGPDPQSAYDDWEALCAWAASVQLDPQPYDASRLGPPVPAPTQVFAIGLNYAAHAAESGSPVPGFPPTFTKFRTAITGPDATVVLPSAAVDWEVELVVVIGRRAYEVAEADAWDHVAGVTVGQDLSERVVQRRPPVPQFSLGKSFPGFAPMGPWVVTPDELADRDDLELGCTVNGEQVQLSRTSDLIFSVPALIERLSGILPLLPGDIIYTGTPSGVGMGRTPPRFLQPGDELVSTIEGIGTITTHLVAKA
jgi:2-keto-4-pentenoate hydratase/2-oxohepta-3-ene-1,7-dioic acid hydratase in catechol pathway